VAGYDLSSQLEAIENLMNQEVPAMLVLRAAVLLHLAQGGIRQKVLENFKREFLQVSPRVGCFTCADTFSADLWIPSFAAFNSARNTQPLIKITIPHNFPTTTQAIEATGGRGGRHES
jgi:hypothetical protein